MKDDQGRGATTSRPAAVVAGMTAISGARVSSRGVLGRASLRTQLLTSAAEPRKGHGP